MGDIVLSVPDDLDLALNVAPGELPHELLFAAAVKLFEIGKISAGKAAELAGMPKPLFLTKLTELGVSACTLTAEDVAEDIMHA